MYTNFSHTLPCIIFFFQELSHYHKLKFSNPLNFTIHKLTYPRSTTLGSKDTGMRKTEFEVLCFCSIETYIV